MPSIEKMRKEYAFTSQRHRLGRASAAIPPALCGGERTQSRMEYLRALRDFSLAIPGSSHSRAATARRSFKRVAGGGLGMAIRQLDDRRVVVNFVLDGGPANHQHPVARRDPRRGRHTMRCPIWTRLCRCPGRLVHNTPDGLEPTLPTRCVPL